LKSRGTTSWIKLALVLSAALFATALMARTATEAGDAAAAASARTSRLQGSVAIDRRTWVIGANVLVQRQDDPSQLILTSTDAKGVFRVDGLADGEYRVDLTRDGLAPIEKTDVSLRFPFRAVVEVTMKPVEGLSSDAGREPELQGVMTTDPLAVRGEVRDRDGAGVGEVRVRFVRIDGSTDPRLVRSSPEGTFEITDLSAGEWRAEIWGVGFLALRKSLELTGDTRLDVVLVTQPSDYKPTPLELMPPEHPVAPAGLEDF
jgi:hypothetical protein